MNFIIWIVIGGLIGWAASIVMKTDAQQGVVLNVVVGIVGALVGGWLLSPLFGTHTKFLHDRREQIFQDQKTEMQIYYEFTVNQRSCATRDPVKLRISFD